MKILYFDCSNGISGDMLLNAVSSLSGNGPRIYEMMEKETLKGEHEGHDDREKHHGHSHGPVSYTHLDVYKRQGLWATGGSGHQQIPYGYGS